MTEGTCIRRIEIPVDPPSVERFKKWCAYYGMTIKKKQGVYWEVSHYEDIDLYWLGCNMTMPGFKNGIIEHK